MSETILQRVARGEMAAMQQCIDAYGPLVWSLARRLCHDRSEAEDGVQEAFVSLWENAARFDPARGAEVTFVSMIARRRLIDRGRARSRSHAFMDRLKDRAPTAVDTSEDQPTAIIDEAQRAREAMSQLSDGQRKVLQLAIHGGYSHEKIAELTDLPLGTVKTHARRGLIRLREVLAEVSAEAQAGVES